MPHKLTPACPKCGNAAPHKISERKIEFVGGTFEKPPVALQETLCVFECDCGVSYTHSVYDDLKVPAIEETGHSLTGSKQEL